MKKRIMALAAAGALLLAMTGCSSSEPAASESAETSAEATVEATEAPTEEPSEEATEAPTEEASAEASAESSGSPLDLSADGDLAGMTYKYSPAWDSVPQADMPEGYETAGYAIVNTDPVIAASISLQVQPNDVYEAAGQTGEDIAQTLATMYGVVDAQASETTFDGIDCWMFTGTGTPLENVDQEVTATGYVVPANDSYYFIMTMGGADSATQDLLKQFTDSVKMPA